MTGRLASCPLRFSRMKTIINRRFLIGLIISTLLFRAAAHGLHAIQINRQSSFLLEEAHRAQKEKQFELCLNRFQQYTKLAPDDTDALAEFGLLLADSHAAQLAVVTLEKVLRAAESRRRAAAARVGRDGNWPSERCQDALNDVRNDCDWQCTISKSGNGFSVAEAVTIRRAPPDAIDSALLSGRSWSPCCSRAPLLARPTYSALRWGMTSSRSFTVSR